MVKARHFLGVLSLASLLVGAECECECPSFSFRIGNAHYLKLAGKIKNEPTIHLSDSTDGKIKIESLIEIESTGLDQTYHPKGSNLYVKLETNHQGFNLNRGDYVWFTVYDGCYPLEKEGVDSLNFRCTESPVSARLDFFKRREQ